VIPTRSKLFILAAVAVVIVSLSLLSCQLVKTTVFSAALEKKLVIKNHTVAPATITYAQSFDNTWHTPVVKDYELKPNDKIELVYHTGDWISLNKGILPEFGEKNLNQIERVIQLDREQSLWVVQVTGEAEPSWTDVEPIE